MQVVHIACGMDRWDAGAALAAADARVFLAVGVHPHEATTLDGPALDLLRLRARGPRVVALGETGLDYHYDRSPRDVQLEALERQARLAAELELPLVLHIREAHDEALELLRPISLPRGGMVHCFTGTPGNARDWVEAGMHLSFSGIATFPRAAEVAAAARLCPGDRMLLETDAPFLAPVPVRGRRNEPAFVAHTCQHLALLRGQRPQDLALQCARNARELLGLPEPGA